MEFYRTNHIYVFIWKKYIEWLSLHIQSGLCFLKNKIVKGSQSIPYKLSVSSRQTCKYSPFIQVQKFFPLFLMEIDFANLHNLKIVCYPHFTWILISLSKFGQLIVESWSVKLARMWTMKSPSLSLSSSINLLEFIPPIWNMGITILQRLLWYLCFESIEYF